MGDDHAAELLHEFDACEPWCLPDKVYWSLREAVQTGRRSLLAEVSGRRGLESEGRYGLWYSGVPTRSQPRVAVLPLLGATVPRAGRLSDFLGGVGLDRWGQVFQNLLGDATVSAVVLDIHSEGGSLAGALELADLMYASRGRKPTAAVLTQGLGTSYLLAVQTDRVFVSPSAMAGELGLVTMHVDLTRQAEQEGIRPTLFAAGRFKAELHPYRELTPSAKQYAQHQVDDWLIEITDRVGRGRDVSGQRVRESFGEGRAVSAKESVARDMADGVAVLEKIVRELSVAKTSSQAVKALRAAAMPDWKREARMRGQKLKLLKLEHDFLIRMGRH